MSLTGLQFKFTRYIGLLIAYAYVKGYRLTFGDSYRDPRVHGEIGKKKGYGSAHSCHKRRLAQDFNLFVNFQYISDGKHEAWEDLGRFWKSLNPLCRWGGDFGTKDSNHFSFEYQGNQ